MHLLPARLLMCALQIHFPWRVNHVFLNPSKNQQLFLHMASGTLICHLALPHFLPMRSHRWINQPNELIWMMTMLSFSKVPEKMFSAMGLPLPDLRCMLACPCLGPDSAINSSQVYSKRGRKEASGTEGNSARQWFQDRLCHLLSALQTWHRITLLNKDGQIRMGIQMNCQRIIWRNQVLMCWWRAMGI